MKNRKLNWITIIEVVLLLICTVANIRGLNEMQSIQYVFNLAAIVCAFLYVLVGYRKEGNLFFRLFAWSLVLKEAAAITNTAMNETVPAISFILMLICFACAILIAVSLNLGKTKSYILAALYVFVSVICLITVISGGYWPVITFNGTRLLLAIVMGIMIYEKYRDKTERGTE